MKGQKNMNYYLIDYENTGENGLRGITELNENSCIIIFYSENADKISFDMHQKLMECRASVEYRKISTGKRNALDFQLSTYLGYLIAKCEEDTFYIISKDNGYRAVIDFWKEWDVRQIDKIALSIPKADSPVPPSFMPLPVIEPKAANEPKRETELKEINGPKHETEPGEVNEPQHETEPGEINEPQHETEPGEVNEPQHETEPGEINEPQCGTEPGEINGPQHETEPKEITEPRSLSVKDLREQVALVIPDVEEQENICRFITKYKTKQGVNNALVKLYGSEKAGELYKKIKPLIKDKKGK